MLAAWQAQAAWQSRLHSVLTSALRRWGALTLSRALTAWKDWALQQAGMQRRARAVVALLTGRTQAWVLCVLREHARRKRRSRAARHFAVQRLARVALDGWRRAALDSCTFRRVLTGVGAELQRSLLADVLSAWRDAAALRQWKTGSMLRCVSVCLCANGIRVVYGFCLKASD